MRAAKRHSTGSANSGDKPSDCTATVSVYRVTEVIGVATRPGRWPARSAVPISDVRRCRRRAAYRTGGPGARRRPGFRPRLGPRGGASWGSRFWRSSDRCRFRHEARRGTRKPNCLNVCQPHRPLAERTTAGQVQLLAASARRGAEHGEASCLRPNGSGKAPPPKGFEAPHRKGP
jgi:hypothetical protein